MVSEWQLCRFEELAADNVGAIAIGPFGSRLKADTYVDCGVGLIRGTNLSDSAYLSGEFVYISEATAKSLGNANLKPYDLVFPHRGAIGSVGIVPDDGKRYALSTSLMKISLDRSRADPAFYYYYFRSTQGRNELLKNASQVGTPGIATPLRSLRGCSVPRPTIDDQIKAVEILSALDNRIDLLRQTNVTLEHIAQTLFKSWFVDFDPVRANSEGRELEGVDAATAALFPSGFEESELGLIPKGWRVGRLGELCQNVRTQAKPATLDSSTPYIGLEHMPRGSIALTDAGTASGLASGKFWYASHDVLFGKLRPYFHKVGVASHTGVCSTDILVIRANSPAWFGYTTMQLSSNAIIAHATRLSNGAKMPRSSWSDIADYTVVIPPERVVAVFDALARAFVEKIHTNVDASSSLAGLRDTLLPRLISGKVRLPKAEVAINEVAA